MNFGLKSKADRIGNGQKKVNEKYFPIICYKEFKLKRLKTIFPGEKENCFFQKDGS